MPIPSSSQTSYDESSGDTHNGDMFYAGQVGGYAGHDPSLERYPILTGNSVFTGRFDAAVSAGSDGTGNRVTHSDSSDPDYFIIDTTGGSTEYAGSVAAGSNLTFTVQVFGSGDLSISRSSMTYSSLQQFGPDNAVSNFYIHSLDGGQQTIQVASGELTSFIVRADPGISYVINISSNGGTDPDPDPDPDPGTGKPDLTVHLISATPNPAAEGGPIRIDFDITNSGDTGVAQDAAGLAFYLSRNGTFNSGDIKIIGVGQDAVAAHTTAHPYITGSVNNFDFHEPGTYTLFAVTDFTNNIDEGSSGENNNVSNGISFTIGGTSTPTNHNPVANSDSAKTSPNRAVTIDVLANDTDPDGDARTLTAVSVAAQHGTAVISSGKVVYTPTTNYVGPDTFQYTISDGKGGTATGSVSVDVKLPTATVIAEAHQVTEGDSEFREITFSVKLDGNLSHDDVFIGYTVQGIGGAVAGEDFEDASGTLQIPDGALIRDIKVKVFGDTHNEGNEQFQLVLHKSQTANLPGNVTTQPYTATIIDDDQPTELPSEGGTDEQGRLLPNLTESQVELAGEIKDMAEHVMDHGYVEELFGGKLSPAAQKAKGWVKAGLDKLEHLETLTNSITTINKALKDYHENHDFGRAIHVTSQDLVSWLGSGYVGAVGGAILTAGLAPLIGVPAAVAIGVIGGGYLVSSAKTWWDHVMPPPPDFVDPSEQAILAGESGGAKIGSAAASGHTSADAAALNAASITYTGVLATEIGQLAPEPYWRLDPTTGQITILKPLTAEVLAKLNESASRQGLLVDNPVGFKLQGDQDQTNLNDILIGGSGNDIIIGGAGADLMVGRQGNDILNGNGSGLDRMDGGLGNDSFIVDNASDKVIEATGEGTDNVRTSVTYVLTAGASVETLQTLATSTTTAINLFGNEFANTIIGNAAANTLDGRGGADILRGLGGNDTYYVDQAGDKIEEAAGAGTDSVRASVTYVLAVGVSVETLQTLATSTTMAINLFGNELANTIIGNVAANTLDGRGGTDILRGLGGNDTYYVDQAGDKIEEAAGAGTDSVRASVTYALAAGVSVETLQTLGISTTTAVNLFGNELANTVIGNAAANTLDGRGGADILRGLGGNDTYYLDQAGDKIEEAAGAGTDSVRASVTYVLAAGVSVETLQTLGTSTTNAINLTGNAFANTIIGNAAVNTLSGGGGADVMRGMNGNDNYIVDNAGDRIEETAAGGTDNVRASVTYALNAGAYVETLQTLGTATTTALSLFGNDRANTVIGNAAVNTLSGGGGADVLRGMNGNDSYYVDNVGDRIEETAAGGTDNVRTSVSYALNAGTYVETLQTLATSTTTAINLFGNELANTIIGNVATNTLDGRGGTDILRGLGGNDTYYVDQAGDKIEEAAGAGTDSVRASVTYALAAGVSVETLQTLGISTTTPVNLFGNELANTVIGNAAVNTLDGRGGADVMRGMNGNDNYIVDNAGDRIEETQTGGTDNVRASATYALNAGAYVETLQTLGTATTNAISLIGNEFANTIIGNAAVNTLSGGGGADVMRGMNGNDNYIVDNTGDRIEETATGGTDNVRASVTYALNAGAYVETLQTLGTATTTAINLIGNELANTVIGNAGANLLNGGGGVDLLRGMNGDNSYMVDNAGDRIEETATGGTDNARAGTSYSLGTGVYVETLQTLGTSTTTAINLYGNEFVNTVIGNNGANIINGRGGSDTLFGKGGSDIFRFDTALNPASNVDTVADFSVRDDTVQLQNSVFTALGTTGTLAAIAFHIGTAAADALDRIVYNATTGALLYDTDGLGGTAGIQFATLSKNLALTNSDFVVI